MNIWKVLQYVSAGALAGLFLALLITSLVVVIHSGVLNHSMVLM